MEEEMEASSPTPTVLGISSEKPLSKLRQVTIRADEEIESVNELLSDGWRVLSIGYRPDATVFVLGQTEQKRRQRTGFGFMRAEENQ